MKNLLLSEIVEKAKSLKITLSYKGEDGVRKRYTKEELITLIEETQVASIDFNTIEEADIKEIDLGSTMVQTVAMFKQLIKIEADKKKVHSSFIEHIQCNLDEAMKKKKKSQVSQWRKGLNIINCMYKSQVKGGLV